MEIYVLNCYSLVLYIQWFFSNYILKILTCYFLIGFIVDPVPGDDAFTFGLSFSPPIGLRSQVAVPDPKFSFRHVINRGTDINGW